MFARPEALWADPASLARLDGPRRPFAPLTRRVVHAVLNRHLPDPPAGAEIVEVGAGLGQLRDWLPAPLLGRVTHTEPAPAYLAEMRHRHPDARTREASAYQLPWPAGSLHAVLGLCVFDTLEDSARFQDELGRVLAPGARFIHFLDLGTDLGSLFRELAADGHLPLPNFIVSNSHPGAPPQDLALTSRAAFAGFLAALERAGHPAAGRVRPYADLFDPRRFDPYAAARRYMAIVSNPASLAAIRHDLREVARGSVSGGPGQFSATPFSSLGHVKRRMEALFVPEAGFRVEMSELIAAREAVPRDPAVHPAAAFLGRCGGQTVVRDRVPDRPAGLPVSALEGFRPAGPPPAGETIVVESVVFAFAATRLG